MPANACLKAIIIDSREPAWVQRLGFGGAMVAVAPLGAGDLLATSDDGALLIVERKTPEDLLGSLRSKRLWPQLAGIARASRWAYLIITGNMLRDPGGKVITDHRVTGWEWSALQGALVKAQEMGVFVVTAGCDEEYEATVLRLARRDHNRSAVVEPAREPTFMTDGERLLSALPSVGPERAAAILQYTATPAWALQFLTDLATPGHVEGIGPGTKRAVRRALGLADNQELSVILTENGQPARKERNGEDENE